MKTLIKKLSLVGGLLSLPLMAAAQQVTPPSAPTPTTITTAQGVVDVIGRIATFATTVLAGLTVLLVIYAAYLYLTGTEDNIKKAKTQLIYVAVGVALIILSASIVPLVDAII